MYITAGLSRVLVAPGFSVPIRASLFAANGDVIEVPDQSIFDWSSADPSVVSVSRNGIATAKGAIGRFTNVTVRFDSLHSSTTIVIVSEPDSIAIWPSPVIFTPGATLALVGRGWGSLGQQNEYFFRFTSSNEAAIELEDHGCYSPPGCNIEAPNVTLMHGNAVGSGTITARTNGKTVITDAQVRLVSFLPATLITGGSHTCAYSTDNVFFCWGADATRAPIGVEIPSGLTSIRGGAGSQPGTDRTCGIDSAGLIQCWSFTNNRPVVTTLSTTVHFTSIAMGSVSSCGIDTGGAAWCWGENGWGQLGNGTKTPSATPVQVSGGLLFVQLSAYGDHACGLTTTGEAWCWGSNFVGEMGSPGVVQACGNNDCSTVPVAVGGGHTFTSITVGTYHSCAIDTNQQAWCWGNSERRGNGGVPTAEPSDVVLVSGGYSWVQLSAAGGHACGITITNEAYCWGSNSNGQAGQDPAITQGPFLAPTLITGGHQFTSIDAGGQYTCAFAADGLYCFGDNSYGQIGVLNQSTGIPRKVHGQP